MTTTARTDVQPTGTTTTPPGRARIGAPIPPVVVLGAPQGLGAPAPDTYLPALPTIASELGASTSATQLTLTATLIGLALGQVVFGPMSDAHGRRRPLLIGLALY